MPEMEIIMQGQLNIQEPVSSLPLLPRLDRLERLLQLLEEKHSLSGEFNKKAELEDEQYTINNEIEDSPKSLSSVLEEVHHKGTLMERLAMLENRVAKLSLDMDEDHTSGSSSSCNVPTSNKLGNDSSTVTSEGNVEKITSTQEKKSSGDLKGEGPTQGSNGEEHTNMTGQQYVKKGKGSKCFKKKFGWFSMGC